MNNVFRNFFNQIGFKTKEMSAKDVVKAEIDEEIEILDKHLKLLERNDSEKEKSNFITDEEIEILEKCLKRLSASKKEKSNFVTQYDTKDYQDQLEEIDKLMGEIDELMLKR